MIDVLKRIGEKSNHTKYPCRVIIDGFGIKINMWVRTPDEIYADRNYMFVWAELEYGRNDMLLQKVDEIFDYLTDYIDRRVAVKRAEPRANVDLVKAIKQMSEYQRKVGGEESGN